MTEGLGRERELTEEEKEKITRDMIEGYKKMAALNRKLAEEDFMGNQGETE